MGLQFPDATVDGKGESLAFSVIATTQKSHESYDFWNRRSQFARPWDTQGKFLGMVIIRTKGVRTGDVGYMLDCSYV